MAVRSGLAAVELQAGKPLPPVEQLQLEKMLLVAFLPHAEELPGSKIALGLGYTKFRLRRTQVGPPSLGVLIRGATIAASQPTCS